MITEAATVFPYILPTESKLAPDLAPWPELPEAIKAGIVAMVRATPRKPQT
jgi:hypothetical protein